MARTMRAGELFPDLVDGSYDCVDRVVLRARTSGSRRMRVAFGCGGDAYKDRMLT
jgi:hypothetical protein